MADGASPDSIPDKPADKSSFRSDFGIWFRGLLMGGADIIPGVSGGTIALIVGIYERLVGAISHIDHRFLKLVLRGQLKAAAAHIDLRFLAALGLGIVCGVGGLASLMHYLLTQQTQYTMAFFFGLILASSHIVSRMLPRKTASHWMLIGAGLVFAYVLVGIPALRQPPAGNWYLFLCGAIAICAMILPGISGAFILLILGKYAEITGIIRKMIHDTPTGSELEAVGSCALGAICGLLVFSKFLKWLLAHYESWTLAVLCGFMLGSLRKIWPFKIDLTPEVEKLKLKQFENVLPDLTSASTWISLVLILVAFASILYLERWAKNRELR